MLEVDPGTSFGTGGFAKVISDDGTMDRVTFEWLGVDVGFICWLLFETQSRQIPTRLWFLYLAAPGTSCLCAPFDRLQ